MSELIRYYEGLYQHEGWDIEFLQFRLDKREKELTQYKKWIEDLEMDIQALKNVIKRKSEISKDWSK